MFGSKIDFRNHKSIFSRFFPESFRFFRAAISPPMRAQWHVPKPRPSRATDCNGRNRPRQVNLKSKIFDEAFEKQKAGWQVLQTWFGQKWHYWHNWRQKTLWQCHLRNLRQSFPWQRHFWMLPEAAPRSFSVGSVGSNGHCVTLGRWSRRTRPFLPRGACSRVTRWGLFYLPSGYIKYWRTFPRRFWIATIWMTGCITELWLPCPGSLAWLAATEIANNWSFLEPRQMSHFYAVTQPNSATSVKFLSAEMGSSSSALKSKFGKAIAFCGQVDPQINLVLLQRCAGVCRVLPLLKVVPPDVILPFCQSLGAEMLAPLLAPSLRDLIAGTKKTFRRGDVWWNNRSYRWRTSDRSKR